MNKVLYFFHYVNIYNIDMNNTIHDLEVIKK